MQYARQGKNLKSKWSLEDMALEELIRSLKMPPVLKDEKLLAKVFGILPEVHVRSGGHTGKRFRLQLASKD